MKDLFKSIDKEKMVSLYDDKSDTSGFYCGRIQKTDEDYVLISHYNQMGFYSGYVLLRKENVFRANQNGRYEKKVEYLSEQNENQIHHQFTEDENLLNVLLEHAKQEKLIVLIELCESNSDDLQGRVSWCDDFILEIECFDEYGFEDGISTVYIEDISVVKCDTNPCREISLMIDSD